MNSKAHFELFPSILGKPPSLYGQIGKRQVEMSVLADVSLPKSEGKVPESIKADRRAST